MGRSHILEEETYKQLNRMLLKVPHPKIQRLLLSGYKVYRVDPLLHQIFLRKPTATYNSGLKEIVVYPHSIIDINTYLKQTEASGESRALLLRYNAARVMKALRSKNTKTEVKENRIIAFTNRVNIEASKKKFDRWKTTVRAERDKKKKENKTPEVMTKRIRGHCIKKSPGPGHIICVIAPTKKARKKVRELLGNDKFFFQDCVPELKDLSHEAHEFVQERAQLNEKYEDKHHHNNEVTSEKNLIIFGKTLKECEHLLSQVTWEETRKWGDQSKYTCHMWIRNLDSTWRSTGSGGVLEAK